MLIVFNVALCLHGICLCCCSCCIKYIFFFFYLRPSMCGRWQDGSVWKGIWLGMLSITSPTQGKPNWEYRSKITSALAALDILFSQIVVLQHTMREMWHHLYLFALFYISDAFFCPFSSTSLCSASHRYISASLDFSWLVLFRTCCHCHSHENVLISNPLQKTKKEKSREEEGGRCGVDGELRRKENGRAKRERSNLGESVSTWDTSRLYYSLFAPTCVWNA